MKYIDSEKLIVEIERLTNQKKKQLEKFSDEDYCCSVASSINCELSGNLEVLSIIKSLQQEQLIKVYRVENEKEQKGLWRKFDGTWEPLFDMLTDGQCKDMPMEDNPIYREGGKQWFASAPSKETLQKWFSKRDLEELSAKGFTISEFEVVGHKKISDFEYIFTRDSIISRTYLKVSDIYPQEQPSGLDEAAEKYSENILANNEDLQDAIEDAFKAGAEWMEGQGYVKEGIARPDDCEIWVNMTNTDIKDGDEVIVQIRKK